MKGSARLLKNTFLEDLFSSVDGWLSDYRLVCPFSTKKLFYKFRRLGLRYEFDVSLTKGRSVRVHSAFPCLFLPDINNFKPRIGLAPAGLEKVV